MKLKRILKWSTGIIFLALIGWGFVAYWMSTNECDSKTVPNNPVKAIVHCEYGGPAVFKVEEVEKPTPTDKQVLVRVRAASVNPLDLTIRGAWPLRPFFGMRKPKDTRPGVDYAGTVEAVRINSATAGQVKPGDNVFGGKNAAIAEHVCVLADRSVVLQPTKTAGLGGAGWHEGFVSRLAGELNGYVRSRFVSGKFITYIATFNKEDMTVLADLLRSGKMISVIDKTYKLSETADALRYLEQGHARGKAVITLDDNKT